MTAAAHIGTEPGVYTAALAVPTGAYYSLTAINASGESDYSNVLLTEPALALLFVALLLWWLATARRLHRK